MKRTLFLLCVVFSGCEPGFRPETLVENLRLIGISSSPADLRPGEASSLSALVLDPSRAQPSTVLWLGCEPDPYNGNRSACANPDILNDPSALGGSALPPGVSVIGFNDQAQYSVPAGLFDVFAADDPRRKTGTVGQLVAFAVAETVSPAATQEELEAVFTRVKNNEVKSIVALFRINIFEGDARNTNPVVDALTIHGEAWPANAHVLVKPGEEVPLDIAAPDSSFEPYVQTTPSGDEALDERILAAWYSTSGRFTETRTALREDVKTVFTAPGGADEKDPVPERRTGTLYTVFRDTRGGQAWRAWRFFVCDASLAEPTVSNIEWPVNVNDPIVLRGAAMASVLDVIVDGVALERGAYSPTNDTWEGYLPAGSTVGNARGVLHAKTCTRTALVP
ncbi:MAG: hypothetical protein ACO1OB_08705 [Archangium sp.]